MFAETKNYSNLMQKVALIEGTGNWEKLCIIMRYFNRVNKNIKLRAKEWLVFAVLMGLVTQMRGNYCTHMNLLS